MINIAPLIASNMALQTAIRNSQMNTQQMIIRKKQLEEMENELRKKKEVKKDGK